MSLLGTLEQFRLPNVLQRIESHEKTGLLVVRHAGIWVEFYVRNGGLLCIGPVRTSATLGDRLVQDKLISRQVWQETQLLLGSDMHSEMRVALSLMELGYVTREQLRSWTTEKSLTVVSAILAWTSGEIYFEEDTQPPADRLLVSLSITTLLDRVNIQNAFPQTQSVQISPTSSNSMPFKAAQESIPSPLSYTPAATSTTTPLAFSQSAPVTPKADIARVLTLTEASQFLDEPASDSSKSPFTTVLPETESIATFLDTNNDSGPNTNEISFASLASLDDFSAMPPAIQAEIVRYPTPAKRIDTSFMQPAMVLVPADLSAFHEQNPKVQITPDQWRLLTCVDGLNSLQLACQLLGLAPDVICTLAGELVAEGLIYVVPPEQLEIQQSVNDTRDLSIPGLTNAHVAPSHPASSASSFADALPNSSTTLSFETESQWGNGGNGATFVPGRGWVTAPQTMQPLYSLP